MKHHCRRLLLPSTAIAAVFFISHRRYASDNNKAMSYAKIAQELHDKTARDVAIRLKQHARRNEADATIPCETKRRARQLYTSPVSYAPMKS
ncbi:hypothetical protein L2E82_00488 [Cichorium intybus]|uniref:Uncharacterized protein n=1 Tax=Cichorium intybus TaxID=13427 RepID=A0ACB9GWJ9_CICIN|nr:hypothetical protein L2E82_00488 [Cichorium intybus]